MLKETNLNASYDLLWALKGRKQNLKHYIYFKIDSFLLHNSDKDTNEQKKE